jgi:hypothetical protein
MSRFFHEADQRSRSPMSVIGGSRTSLKRVGMSDFDPTQTLADIV